MLSRVPLTAFGGATRLLVVLVPVLLLLMMLLLTLPHAASAGDSRARCSRSDSSCWPTAEDVAALIAALDPNNAARTIEAASGDDPQPQPVAWGDTAPLQGIGPQLQAVYTLSCDDAARARPEAANGLGEVCFDGSTFSPDVCAAATRNAPKEGWTPAFVVWPLTAQHVATAVAFASHHNLRVCVAGTGHDFLNRHSCGHDSLLIRTGLLKSMDWTVEGDGVDAFGVGGTPSGFVRLGAGVNWGEAHQAAASRDRVLVSGHAATVGVVGWSIGGGHSFIGPGYGLGVDQILEVQLVLANATLVTASATEHAALFWALRGGGGSVWGVVTAMTLRLYPTPLAGFQQRIMVTQANLDKAEDMAAMEALVDNLMSWSLGLSHRWGGLTSIAVGSGADQDATVAQVLGAFGISDCATLYAVLGLSEQGGGCSDDAVSASAACDASCQANPRFMASWCPVTCKEHRARVTAYFVFSGSDDDAEWTSTWDALSNTSIGQPYWHDGGSWSFDTYWDKLKAQSPEPISKVPSSPANDLWPWIASALVSRDAVGDGSMGANIKSRLADCTAARGYQCVSMQIYDTVPGNVGSPRNDPEYTLTSVSRGFRDAHLHVLEIPHPSDTWWVGADELEYKADLYDLAPNSYFAESDYALPGTSWQDRYWGADTYARLLAVKQLYDPDGLFWCHHCVGDGAAGPDAQPSELECGGDSNGNGNNSGGDEGGGDEGGGGEGGEGAEDDSARGAWSPSACAAGIAIALSAATTLSLG